MKLRLKVVPGASRNSHEWMDSEEPLLKVRVTAPPKKGKANRAVEKYLASLLGLPTSDVTIVSGTSSQQKKVEIHGLTEDQLLSSLSSS